MYYTEFCNWVGVVLGLQFIIRIWGINRPMEQSYTLLQRDKPAKDPTVYKHSCLVTDLAETAGLIVHFVFKMT